MLSILFYPRLSLASDGKPVIFLTNLILLLLKFNSTRHLSSGISSVSIRLLLKFKVRKELSLLRPLVSIIILSYRSSVSKLVKFSRFLMFLIWLFARLSCLNPIRVLPADQKQLISVNLFELMSSIYKLGKLTRWSIFLMLLFESTSVFIASSPSNNGTACRFLESRSIFSGFACLSTGLLYTIITLGICFIST